MTSTENLSNLANRILKPQVEHALSDIDVLTDTPIEDWKSISVDELSARVLPASVDKAFPEVDVTIQEFGIQFEFKELNTRIYARGMSVTVLLVATTSFGVAVTAAVLALKLLLSGIQF